MENQKKRMGFYTTRFVEARDKLEAETYAVEMIQQDPKLNRGMRNAPNDRATIAALKVTEVEELRMQHGFAFYNMSFLARLRCKLRDLFP
jgi:hypothetical protein